MNSIKIARVLVLGTFLLACQEIFAADEAKEAAENFYRSYLKLRASGGLSGIPNEPQLAQLSPFLTPRLRGLFSAAFREQQRCITQFPADKPPWIEGDVFSSSFEGFTSYSVASSKPRAQGRQVNVRFPYVEGKNKVKWTETLVLGNDAGRWLVDDIFYRAHFAFTSGLARYYRTCRAR